MAPLPESAQPSVQREARLPTRSWPTCRPTRCRSTARSSARASGRSRLTVTRDVHDGCVVKQRARRGEPALPAATVLIRGDLLDPDMLATSAQRNYEVYGFYGISVFAETEDTRWTDLAASRFARVEWLVLFTAGDLVASGLELWDTGLAPHFDVVHESLSGLVARMLGTSHRVVQNPHHEPGAES